MNTLVALSALAGLFLILAPVQWIVFMLLFFAAAWNPSVRLGPFGVYASTALIGVLCLKTTATSIRERRAFIPVRTRTDRAMATFFAYTVCCTIAFGQGISAYKRQTGLLLFYMGYVALRNLVRSPSKLNQVLSWVGYSSVLAGTMGLYTYYFRPFLGSKKMAYGAFGNPNGLASYLFLTIPLLLYFLGKEKRGPLWWTLPLIPIFCLLRTGSRTGMLALSLIAFVWIARRRPIILLFCLVFSPALLLVAEDRWQLYDRYKTMFDMTMIVDQQKAHLVPVDVGREAHSFALLPWTYPGQFDSVPDSLGARYVIWGQALAKIPQAPIFGWGPNTVRLSGLPYDSKWFDNCFNQYISITLDFGILGLISLGGIGWGLIKDTRPASQLHRLSRDLPFLLSCILIGQIAHACAEDPIYAVLSNWTLAFLIAAFTTSSVMQIEEADGT